MSAVDASRRASRRLTKAERTVWRDFLRAHAAVTRALEEELSRGKGLPLTWYDVMVQLVDAPGHRLRMAELADRILLSRSGLTRLVDRLANAGLVEREPCPDDARGTFTVLTPAGYARLKDAAPLHLTGVLEHMMCHVGPDELPVLASVLRRVADAHRVPVDADAHRVPVGAEVPAEPDRAVG